MNPPSPLSVGPFGRLVVGWNPLPHLPEVNIRAANTGYMVVYGSRRPPSK